MQPRGVDEGCMTFALTCNLHSVGRRKGPEIKHLGYFLRTIHAHVPDARVILVRLLLPCITSCPNKQTNQRFCNALKSFFQVDIHTQSIIHKKCQYLLLSTVINIEHPTRYFLNALSSYHAQVGTHADMLRNEVRIHSSVVLCGASYAHVYMT